MPTKKRKYGDGDDDDDDNSSNVLYSNRKSIKVTVGVDPTYGQKSAIPGLDDDTRFEADEDGLTCDEDIDALRYLRAVRLVKTPLLSNSQARELCSDFSP